jgi:alkaline phosphatase
MVPVFSFGPKSELFSGIYDNTAIFDKMLKAVME